MATSRISLFLAILVVAPGCSMAFSQSLQAPTTRVRSALVSSKRDGAKKHARAKPSPVEQSLVQRGVQFGTDGSARALFAFIREHYPVVTAKNAAMGDVLFFDMGDGCGGHTGLIETIEPSGRIGFRERRDGDTRHSYVTPRTPYQRRDEHGRIMNTFLRVKRMDDTPSTAYFAGEMLCAVFRIRELP